MTQTSTKEEFYTSGSNVFSAGIVDEAYWDNYLAARPKYSRDFYDIIYAYHDMHSESNASYKLAHDVGTGPGQVIRAISSRIDHIVGSDANSSHLAVAAHRLADICNDGRVEFIEALGEQIAEKCPDDHGRVDFVVAGESFALMDTDRALKAFATLLKPGGTLALWYYGRPIFVDAPPKCQEIYDRLMTTIFRPTVSRGTPSSRAMWKRASEIMLNWLDNIPFATTEWDNVERHKWNPSSKMIFCDETAFDEPLERSSAITSVEKVIAKDDLDFWGERWDLADVKRFAMANVPSFRNDEHREHVDKLWEELGKALGDEGRKYKIGWPVVLILASRKEGQSVADQKQLPR